jgi:hypothetical protein
MSRNLGRRRRSRIPDSKMQPGTIRAFLLGGEDVNVSLRTPDEAA